MQWAKPMNSEKQFMDKFETKEDLMLLRDPEVLDIRKTVQINDKENLFKA